MVTIFDPLGSVFASLTQATRLHALDEPSHIPSASIRCRDMAIASLSVTLSARKKQVSDHATATCRLLTDKHHQRVPSLAQSWLSLD